MYELQFLLHLRKKFREVFDSPDYSGLFLGNNRARFLSILLRQETLFLRGFTSCLRHVIASRHFRSASAYWDAGKES
jgi:hypothetical protein